MFLRHSPPGDILLFIPQINVLCIYYVPDTVLGIRVKAVNKTKILVFVDLTS